MTRHGQEGAGLGAAEGAPEAAAGVQRVGGAWSQSHRAPSPGSAAPRAGGLSVPPGEGGAPDTAGLQRPPGPGTRWGWA